MFKVRILGGSCKNDKMNQANWVIYAKAKSEVIFRIKLA